MNEGSRSTVWVSVAEAAERSGLDTGTVRQWYRAGRIPTQRAEGERGAFLVPLDTVLELAERVDEEGDDNGAALIDANAGYWSAQNEAAREEAALLRDEVAVLRTDLAGLQAQAEKTNASRLASEDQLSFLRSQLAEASEDNRRLENQLREGEKRTTEHLAEWATANNDRRHLTEELGLANDQLADAQRRLTALEDELARLRAIQSATSSITDNSWLDLPTNAYRSPVRPQRLAHDALAAMVADTRPEESVNPTAFDDEPFVSAQESSFGGAEEPTDDPELGPTPAPHPLLGEHDDDVLPATDKKGRRGRR